MERAKGPLDGIRVVEISSVVLGPYAGQMLGDFGADVIKVESPNGDSMRHAGPGAERGMGPLFMGCNRNKRSLAVNLKQPAGRMAVESLLRTADVLLHNTRPGVMARLGLDYEHVSGLRPSIIYCSTFGYGRHGPYAARAAYDDSVQAASGLASLSIETGGDMSYLPTIVADKTTALVAVQSILAALFHRERSGQGQAVDVPMFETMAGWVAVEHLWGRNWEPAHGEAGYPRVLSHDRRPYRTADGQYLSVLPYTDTHWREFCERAGEEGLARDARFSSIENRLRHIDDCYAAIAAVIARRSLDEWLDCLGPVPVMRANTVSGLCDDPHLAATGFWQQMEHAGEGVLRMASPPSEFSASPASIRRPPPRLGEHSREILSEAGLDPGRVEELLRDGVVVDGAG